MAQYDFGTIDPNTKSGTALASDLNSFRTALHSSHSGATQPSYIVAGMLWVDTTSANYELKLYDGAQSIPVAVIDATNNVARVAVDPAETSYITSTTNAQIRHVIANTDVFTTRATGIQFNIASPVIADSNNNELISFTTTASAVNQVSIANSATGTPPTISTTGGDTNIDLFLTAKGSGIIYTYSETAATNTIIDVARLESRSTGTPAAGIGAGLLFSVETAANNFEIGARIEAVTTDVTATSEDFDIVFKTMAAGAAAAERMRIRSTGVVNVDALSIANVAVTSTAAELNILDGVTSTAAELNLVDGSVAATIVNSKAVIYGAAGQVLAATAAAGTNTTQVATTAFVQTAVSGVGVASIDVQEFTTAGSATWTKPANALYSEITVVGGGGGGSNGTAGSMCVTAVQGAGGSAGGGAILTKMASALGATETVTIGAGGVAGSGSGGTSSFGAHASATGGAAGAGAAGVGSGTGAQAITGEVGEAGGTSTTTGEGTGSGGSSIAAGRSSGAGTRGAGGRGGQGTGTAGGAGYVRVVTYCS